MKKFLVLVMVLVSLISLTACGGGVGVTTPNTPTPGTEKELQLAQTTIEESTVEQDVLSQLNTIRSNKSIHLRLSKIAKAQAPSDVYFVIAKVDSTVTGDIGTINYNFAYSENNDASTLVEGVVTYNFEWRQENGVYHWVRTGFNVNKQPAKKLGTVKGKVINGITGLPVGGVRVYAEGRTNGKASLSVLTDDNGQYQISGIVEGDYEVQAYVEQFEVASSGTVQVQGGQVTDVADLKLLPQVDGYKVLMKGKVIDGDGNNAAGVKVELSGATNETTLTDAGGNYTFGMVAAGNYKLLVTKRYKTGFETKQVDVAVTDAEIRAGNNKVIDTIYLSNKAPVVEVVQPAGGSISVNPGDVVTMKLNVTDADSSLTSMKYDWQFPVNAVVPVDMSQGNVIEWPAPNVPGTYEVKVVVYDEKGGVAEKKISVTVKNPNVPPVINLTATASGLTVTLSGSVTDSDGIVSSVGINWGDSATSSVTSGFSSISVSHTYLAAGTYTIMVTATDNSGGSSSKEIVVTVNNPVAGWKKVTSSFPWATSTNNIPFVSFKGKLWVISSTVKGEWYSEDGINWTKVTSAPDAVVNRAGHSCLVFNNKMWIMGGETSDGYCKNDVWSSDDGLNWEQVTANAYWAPRIIFAAQVFNGMMWVMGGTTYSSHQVLNDVWYSSDGVKWQRVSSIPWEARDYLYSAVVGGKMWVFGGSGLVNDVPTGFYDRWYSSDGKTWTKLSSSSPWGERTGYATAFFQDKLWIVGGMSFNPTTISRTDVWCSDNGIDWTKDVLDGPIINNATSTVFNDHLWVLGNSGLWVYGY